VNLLLGQTVDATDGPFGKITDIIVDAQDWTVAHLIVRPFENEQARKLVPFWLVSNDGPMPVIGLAKSYAMRLEMVPLVGLVSIAAEPLVETQSGVKTTDLVSAEPLGDTTVVGRPVRSIDGEFAGRVCGFSVTNRHLDKVLIRSGELDVSQLAPVPMVDVHAIWSHHIDLYISRSNVEQLCTIDQVNRSTRRQPNFERDTIHAAIRLNLSRRGPSWAQWQTRRRP
jgi:hypothetical protein